MARAPATCPDRDDDDNTDPDDHPGGGPHGHDPPSNRHLGR